MGTLRESLSLQGKVAIVTGGSRGLGKEMARSLAMAGADVCIASRTQSQLDETASWMKEQTGRDILAIPTDVQRSEQCDALIAGTVARFGRLDIMVNNAGIGDRRGAGAHVWDLEDADWLDTIEVNLHSTFYCTRAAARQMRDQDQGGAIVNVASGTALRSYTLSLGYAAAKAGVISLTKSTAAMLLSDNIRVNCIVPGYVLQSAPSNDEEAERAASRGRFIPVGRLGEAWELGPLCQFLASDASSYVTGEIFIIDGGGIAGGIAPIGWEVSHG